MTAHTTLALAWLWCAAGVAGDAVDLTRHAAIIEPADPPALRSRWTVEGPWIQMARTPEGHRIWTTRLPLDPTLLGRQEAGSSATDAWEPEGVTLHHDGTALPWQRHPTAAHRWSYSRVRIHLTLPADAGRPGEVTLEGQPLIEREARRGPATLTDGDEVLRGLALRPGDVLSWDITLPARARLDTLIRRLPPVVAALDPAQAGAVRWSLTDAHGTHTLGEQLATRAQSLSVSLSRWQGQRVRLTAEHRGPTHADGVFLGAPVVFTAPDAPRRVVVVMLDTVRRDHLGLYGYSRPTSPRLDAWAEQARVFDNARTVAPWTLPSTQAALTGVQPERFDAATTLAEHLVADGWHTEGVVANVYLSPRFGLHRGFNRYRTDVLLDGTKVVQHAINALQRHPDRDTLVFVQLMDAHLPYREGSRYRWRFTERDPPGFAGDTLVELRQLRADAPEDAAARAHAVGRYDNNLRLIDDALGSLLSRLGPDDTVLIFSDHGEEFWDHGEFEHGHSFYDELLRVPLVLRGPGVQAGRDAREASLLDITPTLLALLGVDAQLDGHDLLGDGPTTLQGFGRPLYGDNGWGYAAGGTKWVSRSGQTKRFDLDADPREQLPQRVAEDGPHAATLGEHLGAEIHRVSCVRQPASRASAPLRMRFEHPRGIDDAWLGPDPRGWAARVGLDLTAGAVTLTVPAGTMVPREIYVLHDGDATALTVELDTGEGPIDALADPSAAPWPVRVTQDWAPKLGHRVTAPADTLTEDALRELGYLD